MSGLFDKRADGASRREARSQKEHLARRKSRIISISVVSVVALVFICALFINSNIIRRTMPAITIGGIAFSAAEFDYFYNAAYFEYHERITEQFSQMPELAASMLPAPRWEKPFPTQVYNHDTGETWADFFVEWAIRSMSELVGLYNASIASGFVLEGEQRLRYENEIEGLLREADMYSAMQPHNYPTPASYLQALYGNSINEATLRKVMEFVFTAISYSEHVRDSISYSGEDLEAYYLENRDDLDIFKYRTFFVPAESVFRGEHETEEDFIEAQETVLTEARELAMLVAASISTEEDFIESAAIHGDDFSDDPDSSLREMQGEWLDSDLTSWLLDRSRSYGDVGTVDVAAGTHVLFFINRDDNDYQTTSMRQILIIRESVYPEDYPEGEDDPDFIAAVEYYETEARERAETVFELFLLGGATEEHLIELMEEHSDDSTDGGFYDGMAKFHYFGHGESFLAMRVVSEIEDWLFEPWREFGDFELVNTEAFGYHLLYFMGHGERFRDIISGDRMRTRDYALWKDELPEPDVSKHWVFSLTQQ